MSKALKRDLPIIISVVCHDSRLALGRKVIVFSFFLPLPPFLIKIAALINQSLKKEEFFILSISEIIV